METLFLLDTNAYRQLAADKYLCNLKSLAYELRRKGAAKNARSVMSVVVTMELLRHMDETDPHFLDCFKALTLQNFHNQTHPGEPGNNIDFIPPINPLISQHFFKTNSDYMKYYYRIVQIANQATENVEPDDWKKDNEDIQVIAKQLMHERTELKGNFQNLIDLITPGKLDWKFQAKNSEVGKKLLKQVKEGQMIITLALAMLNRAHQVVGLPFIQPGLEEKFEEFLIYYQPMLEMNLTLMQKFLSGFPSLSDPKNKAWNTLNDMQLLASACYIAHRERENDIRVILVTDDKAIHQACKNTYMELNVWKVGEYIGYIFG